MAITVSMKIFIEQNNVQQEVLHKKLSKRQIIMKSVAKLQIKVQFIFKLITNLLLPL